MFSLLYVLCLSYPSKNKKWYLITSWLLDFEMEKESTNVLGFNSITVTVNHKC